MRNLEQAKERISTCRRGHFGGVNNQKQLMQWIVDNEDKCFRLSDLATEFNCDINTLISALRNLKVYGFKFNRRHIGPNSFEYTCTGYYPKVKVKKAKKTVHKKDLWNIALGI